MNIAALLSDDVRANDTEAQVNQIIRPLGSCHSPPWDHADNPGEGGYRDG